MNLIKKRVSYKSSKMVVSNMEIYTRLFLKNCIIALFWIVL